MSNILQKTVETGAGPVVVRKLALYDYAEFIRALRNIPSELSKLFQSDQEVGSTAQVLAVLPPIIADSFDDFAGILAVATDKDVEFFKSPDFDLADALLIVDAALELNDFKRIVETVKKIAARGRAATPAAETAPENTTKPKN